MKEISWDDYMKVELPGKQVIGVINFPNKQIANMQSECLVTGFYDSNNKVVLAVPDKKLPPGSRLL